MGIIFRLQRMQTLHRLTRVIRWINFHDQTYVHNNCMNCKFSRDAVDEVHFFLVADTSQISVQLLTCCISFIVLKLIRGNEVAVVVVVMPAIRTKSSCYTVHSPIFRPIKWWLNWKSKNYFCAILGFGYNRFILFFLQFYQRASWHGRGGIGSWAPVTLPASLLM